MTHHIQTYIDMGSSATKGFYWHHQPALLHLAPQVARLNPTQLDRLMLGGLTRQEPEDSAHIILGDSAYAVGAHEIAPKKFQLWEQAQRKQPNLLKPKSRFHQEPVMLVCISEG